MRLRRKLGLTGLAGVLVVVPMVLWIGGAAAATHGIGFQKGCNSPTKIGDPVVCHYTITNNNFTNASLDTVKINSLADITHAAAGDTPNTNILGNLELYVTAGTPTCVATGGTGTFADPWTGVTECTLPGGNVISGPRLGLWSEIQTKDHNGYVTKPADFNINPVTHSLADDANLGWVDQCDIDPTSCNTNQQQATAPSATVLIKRNSLTATDIHNAAHQVVTSVAAGTTVHDFVTVTTNDPDPGNPIPHGGNVFLEWFENGNCTGNPAASATQGPVDAAGHFDATGFSQTPTHAGSFAFRAHYLGDGTYNGSDGACEPLTVVDAYIQITPQNATNAVGSNHVLTITVTATNGGILAAGTATASILTPPSTTGSFVGPSSCNYTGGAATSSCTVTITSAAAGLTRVQASSNIGFTNAFGTVTRTTGTADNVTAGCPANCDNANKVWVDAYIQITPQNATNAVGTPHTLTITVTATNGGILQAGTATASILTPPSTTGSFIGSPSCNYTGGAATASCTVQITSAVAGLTRVQATSNISFTNAAGGPLTRTTGTADNVTAGCPANCGNANKVWVDAFIQITPQNATNAVGTNHVLTITVNATNGGILAAGTATASILTPPSTTGSFVGSPTCNYAGGAATSSCTVTITSAVVGLTRVQATSNISFTNAAGGPLTRTTGTADNVTAGCTVNCDNANKVWVDAFIQITPQNATNPVNTNHVLTITVTATNGGVLAAGTATASILTPPSTTGSFVGSPSCNYTGGAATASCTVTITSAVPGLTRVQATSLISFTNATGSVTRTTGTADNTTAGCPANCDNANKVWVKAKITIAADKTNEINQPHTFTATVFTDNGSGYQPVGAGVDCNITLTGSNGANPVPPGPLNTVTNASGQCSITFTSATPGLVTGHGKSTLSIGGGTVTVETDGTGDNSADARKWFVDANIQISPLTANNPVSTNHVLTVHANVNNGTGAGYSERSERDGAQPDVVERRRCDGDVHDRPWCGHGGDVVHGRGGW